MSLLKSILRKRKFLSTSMFRWRFLKKIFKYGFFFVVKYCYLQLSYLYSTATNNKEFTGKSSLTVLCRKQWKKIGWSTILHELKRAVKAKIAQNNSQLSEGGITVKPGQDSIHELIIWKVNPFVASVTCSRYQIAFKWSVNFWLQLFSIRWDGKYFNGWNFYLGILQIQENWAGRNFITNSRVYSLLIHAKKQTEINNN